MPALLKAIHHHLGEEINPRGYAVPQGAAPHLRSSKVTEKLEKLAAAHQAANKSDWETWPDFDEGGHTGHTYIGPRECPVLVTCCDGVEADAEFVALAHKLMPDLLEAVEMLKMAAHALETPGDFSPEEMQTQVIGNIGAFLARLEGEDVQQSCHSSFNSVPLRTDIPFGDAPGEMGGLWTHMGQAENALAEKLSTYPEGTAVALDKEAWFLVNKDGQRVLCHAEYENGKVTEATDRFDFDLMWVDVGAGDLKSYAERVELATELFDIVFVTL